jgi:hypothetical protein
MLAAELLRLSADKRGFALKLGRYITGNANRPLIIAFDNVDRRESGQQTYGSALSTLSAVIAGSDSTSAWAK